MDNDRTRKPNGQFQSTHGWTTVGAKHPLYSVWSSMKRRCNDPKDSGYHKYGGRGIKVCAKWSGDDPGPFIKWALSHGWEPGLQIDRRNNDGPYSPANCRFITAKRNANNTRKNVRGMVNGESLTIVESAEKYGINTKTMWCRIRKTGMSMQEAVDAEKHLPKFGASVHREILKLHRNGFSQRAIAKLLDMGATTVRRHVRKGKL